MAWNPRKDKTRQDLTKELGERQRVRDWDKRLSFMQTHKPRKSSDWLKFRSEK